MSNGSPIMAILYASVSEAAKQFKQGKLAKIVRPEIGPPIMMSGPSSFVIGVCNVMSRASLENGSNSTMRITGSDMVSMRMKRFFSSNAISNLKRGRKKLTTRQERPRLLGTLSATMNDMN